MTQITPSRRQNIQQFLTEHNTASRFLAIVLTDGDGLPLVSSLQDETRLVMNQVIRVVSENWAG
jgi:hypothetical protein